MVRRDTVVNWAKDMANKRQGVDTDGVYGMQCVDLPSHLSKIYFGYPLGGNGNQITASAKSRGWRSFTPAQTKKIYPGAFFSSHVNGHGYGHTGVVVGEMDAQGRFLCVEQNVNVPAWQMGGPCTYVTRYFGEPGHSIFEWVYPPYEDLNQILSGQKSPGGAEIQTKVGVTVRDIRYGGYTLTAANVTNLLEYCLKYSCMPSGPICQIYLESMWGASNVARTDNNWSGSTWTGATTRPSGVVVSRGSARPANEGGWYMRYSSVKDWLRDYMFLICEQQSGGRKMYNVAPSNEFSKYVAGLFRSGGAQYDYAAAGYSHYLASMQSIRNGINAANSNILDELDKNYKNVGNDKAVQEFRDIANEEKEVPYIGMAIHFGIRVMNNRNFGNGSNDAIYYYNGATNTLTHVPNVPAWQALQRVYEETTGHKLKYYLLDENKPDDRWYKNLFAALNPNANDTELRKQLEEFKKFITDNT